MAEIPHCVSHLCNLRFREERAFCLQETNVPDSQTAQPPRTGRTEARVSAPASGSTRTRALESHPPPASSPPVLLALASVTGPDGGTLQRGGWAGRSLSPSFGACPQGALPRGGLCGLLGLGARFPAGVLVVEGTRWSAGGSATLHSCCLRPLTLGSVPEGTRRGHAAPSPPPPPGQYSPGPPQVNRLVIFTPPGHIRGGLV